MSTFRVVTDIDAPPEACFDLLRSIDLHLESMLASDERAVGGRTSGLICGGEEVTWEARHFGVRVYLRRLMRIRNEAIRLMAERARG